LEDIFVKVSIGYEPGFNLQLFFIFWGNFIAFFQEVVNLIFPLFKKEFSLLVLVVFLPQDILELRENDKF
jgi:hypothetical protein